MKMALLFLCFVSLSAFGVTWNQYVAQKTKNVSHPRHLPFKLSHGYKTAKSVLLIHGIYSSPLHFKGMAQAYFKAGFNVVTVLLPGHWEKKLDSMDDISNADWSKEADLGFELAQQLGDKVILSGHSLGALLSIEQSLKRRSDDIDSLVLISPSLKVWSVILATCEAGVRVNLTGNHFTFKDPDGIKIPYLAPKAGPLIQTLADRVLVRPISVPLFLAFTWNDNVVDVNFVKKYYESVKTNKELYTYSFFSGITHGDISQAPTDEPTYLNKTNREFDDMMKRAVDFIQNHE